MARLLSLFLRYSSSLAASSLTYSGPGLQEAANRSTAAEAEGPRLRTMRTVAGAEEKPEEKSTETWKDWRSGSETNPGERTVKRAKVKIAKVKISISLDTTNVRSNMGYCY